MRSRELKTDRILKLYRTFELTQDRNRLEEIQAIVDREGQAFTVVVQSKDGIPHRIRFEPRKNIPSIIH